MGSYASDGILLHDFAAHDLPHQPSTLHPDFESSVLLYMAQPLAARGTGAEEPMRYGTWLFAVGGGLPADARWRESLSRALPGYLQDQLAVLGAPQTLFATFLRRLRDTGRTDDPRLSARDVAQSLSHTAQDARAAMHHHSGEPQAVLLATNGHLLAATRLGAAPLFYRLEEGLLDCPLHGFSERSLKDADPIVHQHRRARTVLMASHPSSAQGWRELASVQAVGADEHGALALV